MPTAIHSPTTMARLAARRARLRRGAGKRRGVALVEFAITLPLFVMIVLGTIEACNVIYLKQSCEIAAYEAVRATLIKGTTLGSCTLRANNVLTQRGVQGATVTITPAGFDTAAYGTNITVNVTAPCNSNGWFPGWFYNGRNVVGEVVMMKEYAP